MNDSMSTCKTCKHWRYPDAQDPGGYGWYGYDQLCRPIDPDTHEPMRRDFEVRLCRNPAQTFCESPVERNGFGLADGSEYRAVLATAEEFGCVRHEERVADEPPKLSSNPDFPGFEEFGRRRFIEGLTCRVWVDDVEIKNCLAVDSDAGTVTVYKIGADGVPIIGIGGAISTETLTGAIRLQMSDGTVWP